MIEIDERSLEANLPSSTSTYMELSINLPILRILRLHSPSGADFIRGFDD
jgi:hypothetical protein